MGARQSGPVDSRRLVVRFPNGRKRWTVGARSRGPEQWRGWWSRDTGHAQNWRVDALASENVAGRGARSEPT